MLISLTQIPDIGVAERKKAAHTMLNHKMIYVLYHTNLAIWNGV